MKILVAPNGNRIVGTAESMLATYEIAVTGTKPDGTIDFEYTGESKDYPETAEQRKDTRGRRLFTDTDGVDWPEQKLKIKEVEDET
jgi:hypothetical protein